MMKPTKNERMGDFVRRLEPVPGQVHDPCYEGFFTCFNAQRYYEAHDVLEHLWLQGRDGNYAFYKGLIQLAGAYVHLRKQHEHPAHPTHGRRLHPAVRLFRLAQRNLEPYGPEHLDLDVDAVCAHCGDVAERIESAEFRVNPWSPEKAPRLELRR